MSAGITDAFERFAEEVEMSTDAWPRLESRVRARLRRRTATATALVLIVLIAMSGAILKVRSQSSVAPVEPRSEWLTYTDPDYGWTMAYPPEWHEQRVDYHPGRGPIRGALVSNLDRPLAQPVLPPNHYTTAWDFREVPDTFVGVEFRRCNCAAHPPPRNGPGPDSTLPLSLDDARPETLLENEYDQPPTRTLSVVVNRHGGFTVTVWIGVHASEEDIQTARDIVASIAFPP